MNRRERPGSDHKSSISDHKSLPRVILSRRSRRRSAAKDPPPVSPARAAERRPQKNGDSRRRSLHKSSISDHKSRTATRPPEFGTAQPCPTASSIARRQEDRLPPRRGRRCSGTTSVTRGVIQRVILSRRSAAKDPSHSGRPGRGNARKKSGGSRRRSLHKSSISDHLRSSNRHQCVPDSSRWTRD
jgi:hypothetical protein